MRDLPAPVPDVPSAFVEVIGAAFADRPGPRFTLALSGGATARSCYETLADSSGGGGDAIDWSLVDLYLGDERFVPPDDADANQRLVREALIERLAERGAHPGSFTPMPTTGSLEDCVARYTGTVRALMDGPGLDVIHLGLGPDGHTASLFSGVAALDAGPGEPVAATQDPQGNNPHPRITLTLPLINAARTAVFTVSGREKADAVAALRHGEDIPASRVDARRVVWLMDGAAAGAPRP